MTERSSPPPSIVPGVAEPLPRALPRERDAHVAVTPAIRSNPSREGTTAGGGFWKRLTLGRGTPASAPRALDRARHEEAVIARLDALDQRLAGFDGAVTGRIEHLEQQLTYFWEVEEQLGQLVEIQEQLAAIRAESREHARRLRRQLALGFGALAALATAGLGWLAAATGVLPF